MKTILSLLLVLFIATVAFGQAGGTETAASTPAAALSAYALTLIPLLSTLIVAIGKFFAPRIPTWALPIVCAGLGTLLDYVGSLITGNAVSPLVGAVLGAAGVGLREVVDQLKTRITTGPKAIITLLLLACLSFGGAAGCALFKGATPAKAAVNVSDVSKVTMEAALQAWDSYIVQNHPPLDQQIAVRDAWRNYQAAQILILDAALILKEAETAGGNTPEQIAQLNYAIAEASNALADLVKLLQTFGVKL